MRSIARRTGEHPRKRGCWTALCAAGLLFFGLGSGAAQSAAGGVVAPGEDATLADYVAYALRENPSLRSYARAREAMKHVPAQRRALPDPTLSFGVFARSVETRLGPQEQLWRLGQKLPFFGKLSLKGQIAESEAGIAAQAYEEKELDLIERVKRAYFDYYAAYHVTRVTEEERNVLRHMQEVAQIKYASGLVDQQDVLKAQLALSNVEDELQKLERELVGARARLNELLYRDPGAPLAIPRAYVPGFPLEDATRFYGLAERMRPELRAAELAEERETRTRLLAKREYYPDLSLAVQYVRVDEREVSNLFENGRDALLFSAAVNLPVWFGKLRARVREAEERMGAARSRTEDLRSRIRSEVEDAITRVQTARERVGLYRDIIIPQAEQTFRASEAGYRTGKVDFLNYLDSERMLLSVRKMQVRAQADLGRQVAHFERVVGVKAEKLAE